MDYDNDISTDDRGSRAASRTKVVALKDIRAEVELGYDVNSRSRGPLPELRHPDGKFAVPL